jgi:hypothetical protein
VSGGLAYCGHPMTAPRECGMCLAEARAEVGRLRGERDDWYVTTRQRCEELAATERKLAEAREGLAWYGERARSLANKFDPQHPEKFASYVLAIFTELSLDGGKRAALGEAEKDVLFTDHVSERTGESDRRMVFDADFNPPSEGKGGGA